MSLTQCWVVLRARYKIFFAVIAATVLLTLLACLALPKRYTAVTHVVIDLLSQDLIGGAGAALSANSSASYIPTQVEIITSTSVAENVVRRLHLDANPVRHNAWLRATGGQGSEITWIAKELQKQLSVKPTMDSNVIAISFRAADARLAAAAANAFAAAYMETTVELRDGPARDTARWLDARVKEARDMLAVADARVVDYQQAHKIVTSDDRSDAETERLNLLLRQLVAQQERTANATSKLQTRDADGMLHDVAQDLTVMKIQSEISELQGRLSNAAATFGTNHPQTVQMRARLAALNAQLESESARVTSAIEGEAAAGKFREGALDAAIAMQKTRLIAMKAERAQLAQLMKDRDTADAVYRDLSQKYVRTHLLAHSVQTNVSVLAPAFEPTLPSSPRPLLYLSLAALVGALFGCAAAFACEIKDRRVRSEDDIALILGVSSLGGTGHAIRRSLLGKVASWSNA